jgi:hypothetical protein
MTGSRAFASWCGFGGRLGGGGEPTNGWQDKSAAFRHGASGWPDKAILPSLCTPLPALPIDTPTVSMR